MSVFLEDKVNEEGEPTWLRLANIVEYTGDRAIAEEIKKNHNPHNTDPHDADDSNVEIGSTTGAFDSSNSDTIELVIAINDYDMEEEYAAMNRKLSKILTFAIKDIFNKQSLEDIKAYLAGLHRESTEMIKRIKETVDKVDLMALLRSYFSLSNVSALKDFVEDLEIDHNSKELADLLKRKNTFYENILAKDFAKKAIEDHKMCKTDSIITFKVSWNQDTATLKEFEIFLSRAFKSHKIYIRLRVVCQSLLTFVCSIPNWLLEEITEYVNKRKDYLISEGVVEVTIDGAVIFNVEGSYAALIFYEPNDMMAFTAVPSNQLPALLKFIKENHSFAEVDLIHYFRFKSLHGFIELNLFEKPPTGWTVKPVVKPCRLYQDDIDKFNGIDGSVPPCCLMMSVCGLFDPKTKPVLHYPVSLNGIECPVTLSVHRVVKSTILASPITPYTGIFYYERKEDDYLVSFIAARNLKSLVNYIEEQHSLANIVKLVNFDFNSNLGYIKLNFNATTQEKSLTQWTTEPQSGKLFQKDVDNFDDALDYPQSCLISFYGTPHAAQSMQYSLLIEGVADGDTLFIDFTLNPSLSGEVLYIGLVYYEWKLTEYLMTFIAGKKGTKLIQYVEEHHPLAEIDQIFTFSFSSPHGFIELIFDSSYDDSCEGWTVQPFVKPCRLYQDDIDRFDDSNYPFPPSCLTSVHGSLDAVPTLRYSIPLKGVVGTMAIFINLKLRLEKNVAKISHKLHSLEATFKEEKHKKDGEIAALNKKLCNSLEKQSIIAKEKQELSERMVTLIKEQEIPKKPQSLKLFDYDVSKLEIVLQPMEDLWFQLGHQLNVEVSLLSDIQETKDTKEQMRSLLQLCSDKGVTVMQLEGALEAMDQKSLIPVLQEFSRELEASLSTDGSKRLLELELEETKAALDTCKSKQQEQEAVEEMLKNELILKDSEFAKEKSQLLELINQLKDEKQNEIRKQQSLVEQLQETQIDQVFKEKLQENSVGTQSVQQQSTKEVPESNEDVLMKEVEHSSVLEKSQLLEETSKLEDRKELNDFTSQLKEINVSNDEIISSQEKILAKNQDLLSILTNNDSIISELFVTKGANNIQLQEATRTEKWQQILEKELQENSNRALSVLQQLMAEGNDLMQKLSENKEKAISLSTGIPAVQEDMLYAGITYYERNGLEDIVTFTAAKDPMALLEYIKKEHPKAEVGQCVYFSFHPSRDYIELILDHTPQKYPFTGWTLQSHFEPCRLYRQNIHNFGDVNHPIPPSCLISVYSLPYAVPTLHYSIPLEGVVHPVTLFVHALLRNSPEIHESTSVSSIGGATTVDVDVNRVKKLISDVLVSHYAALNSLPQKSLIDLVRYLYTAKLVSNQVRETPSMEECIYEFKASLSFKRKLPQVEEHCQKFLSSFIAVRGSYADAAIALGEDWIEAIRSELEFDFNIYIDA